MRLTYELSGARCSQAACRRPTSSKMQLKTSGAVIDLPSKFLLFFSFQIFHAVYISKAATCRRWSLGSGRRVDVHQTSISTPPSPVSSLNHWTISASEIRLPVQKHNKDFCFWLLITQRTIRITRPSPLFLFNIYLDLSPLYDIFYYLCHRHTMAKLVRFIPLELVWPWPCLLSVRPT